MGNVVWDCNPIKESVMGVGENRGVTWGRKSVLSKNLVCKWTVVGGAKSKYHQILNERG